MVLDEGSNPGGSLTDFGSTADYRCETGCDFPILKMMHFAHYFILLFCFKLGTFSTTITGKSWSLSSAAATAAPGILKLKTTDVCCRPVITPTLC